MAGIQASGVGSGIDTNSLVSQLVAAERAPQERRLNRSQSQVDAQISAVGSLRGALSGLQSALSSVRTVSAFQGRKADVSDDSILTATAAASAANGRYNVEVRQLASAQRLASGPFASGAASVVGTGTLSISVAGSAFNVAIAAPDNTLSGIRDAINNAAGNPGVQATLIQAVDGARLVLTSSKSGQAGAVRVTASGGDGGLDALVYNPGVLSNLSELSPARDAEVRIEGFTVTSATNVLGDAIDGVSLSLREAEIGTAVQVTVGTDSAQTTDKIRKFVADYNAALGTMAQLRRFDPSTREKGPLLGDAMLRTIETRLRSEISKPTEGVAAQYSSLSAIGIRTGADGKLTIDETRLTTALNADFDAVGRMFGGEQGVAGRLYAAVDLPLQTGGQITTRSIDMQNNKRSIETQRDALDQRMAAVERRYRAQFVAMDKLLAQLQSTGNYLTQQLDNLPKPAR